VRLVGFIIRKVVTMHGHMNVKKKKKAVAYNVMNMLAERCEGTLLFVIT
jgi:hypothetical protein